MTYVPVLDCLVANFAGGNQLCVPIHSVLLIETQDDETLIFDGTVEQFGWAKDTWLQSVEDFVDTRLNQHASPSWGFASGNVREIIWDEIQGDEQRFWVAVRARMDELFAELDWDDLREMGDEKRVEKVAAQAKAKFADVKKAYRHMSLREDLRST